MDRLEGKPFLKTGTAESVEAIEESEGLIQYLCTDLLICELAKAISHRNAKAFCQVSLCIAVGRKARYQKSSSVVAGACLTEHVSSFSRSNSPVFGASAMIA